MNPQAEFEQTAWEALYLHDLGDNAPLLHRVTKAHQTAVNQAIVRALEELGDVLLVTDEAQWATVIGMHIAKYRKEAK